MKSGLIEGYGDLVLGGRGVWLGFVLGSMQNRNEVLVHSVLEL